MDSFGSYQLTLSVDDLDIDILPSSFRFIMQDSIYSVFPKMNFTISDSTGKMNEFLALINGTKLTLTFGRKLEKSIICPYRIIKNSVPQQYNQSATSGDIELSLIHDWHYYQSKICNAYNNNVSDIVKNILKTYSFSDINIDETLNSGVWYQPYIEDYKFINDYLIPFSYSKSSNNTPFFFFINFDNVANFKNLTSLNQKTRIEEFSYGNSFTEDNISIKNIHTVNFLQESDDLIKHTYNRIIGNFDKEGNYNFKQNSKIGNYPSNRNDPIPIRINEENITSIKELLDYDYNMDELENDNLGLELEDLDKEFLIEKIVITVDFDFKLKSGEIVIISLPYKDEEGKEQQSLRYSGRYLIETCYHKWDGKNAYTTLVCSKQTIKVTEDYRNLGLIVSR